MFNDLIPILKEKEAPAQQEYELALAEFERAKKILEEKEGTVNKVRELLKICGYVDTVEIPTEPQEVNDGAVIY